MPDKVPSRPRLLLTDPLVPTFLTGVDPEAIILHLVGSVDLLGNTVQDLAPLAVDDVGRELHEIPLILSASVHHLGVTTRLNVLASVALVPASLPTLVG